MTSSRSSWIWLTTALLAIALITALAALPQPSAAPLSTSNPQPDGALALYRWLGQIGYKPRTITSSSLQLDQSRTLWILSPATSVTSRQARDILTWVHRGGRLALVTEGGNPLLTLLKAKLVPGGFETPDVVQPVLLAPVTSHLYGSTNVVADRVPGGVTVAEVRDGAVVVRRQWGRGIIWLVTAPALFQNDHLAHAGNRRLALNLAGRPGPIAFDEYSGAAAAAGPTSLLNTSWGAATFFAVLLVILYRFLSGWRLGPPLPSPEQRGRPAVEYVISMAGLLRRARSRPDVLGIYQRHLRRLLTRHGPPRLGAAEEQAEDLLAPADRLSEEALVKRAEEIVAYEEELRRSRV